MYPVAQSRKLVENGLVTRARVYPATPRISMGLQHKFAGFEVRKLKGRKSELVHACTYVDEARICAQPPATQRLSSYMKYILVKHLNLFKSTSPERTTAGLTGGELPACYSVTYRSVATPVRQLQLQGVNRNEQLFEQAVTQVRCRLRFFVLTFVDEGWYVSACNQATFNINVQFGQQSSGMASAAYTLASPSELYTMGLSWCARFIFGPWT